jgi:hypothetical protein
MDIVLDAVLRLYIARQWRSIDVQVSGRDVYKTFATCFLPYRFLFYFSHSDTDGARVYIFAVLCVLYQRERAFIDHSPWANVLIEIEEEMLERWIDHDRRSSLSSF